MSCDLRGGASISRAVGPRCDAGWYGDLFDSVAGRIDVGRRRAVAAVNSELVTTYWAIGRDILDRQDEEGWGTRVIDRLSADLRQRFPGPAPAVLDCCRGVPEPRVGIVKLLDERQVVVPRQLCKRRLHDCRLVPRGGEGPHVLKVARGVAASVILVHQIETGFRERSGKAITNFTSTLPPADSDQAQQATRDPYLFDFLGTTEVVRERDLESQLVGHVEKFLLELGQGFAFVGQQVHLEVGDQDFYADLLFYHLTLRCYVVIELKAVAFDPGFLGQLGLYMAAVDDLLAHADDKPTIGLLLCKSKNNVVAEYALRGYTVPIGVAEWKTAITQSLPPELASSLPSIEELEAELADPTGEPA